MQNRPMLILFGTGRCGSTVFHRMIRCHPALAWLSRWADKYPSKIWRNRLIMQGIDIPVLGKMLRRRVSPGECYNFWETHIRGFRRPCRDLTADDVMKYHHRLPGILEKTTTAKRDGLLLKITGWPRVAFLKELFPHACFVHVIRDGRAVSASNLKIGFWKGYEGPQNWRWGTLSEEYLEEWHRHGRSFVALAGIQWKILMDAAEESRESVSGENYFEVRYEDLCEDPIGQTRRIVENTGLEWTEAFEKDISGFEMRNTNYKWKDEFSREQQYILLDVLGDHLRKYGYTE